MITIYKGDTATVFYYSFVDKDDAPYSLAGATIVTHFVRTSDGKHKIGAGTHQIDSPGTQGTASYIVGSADVSEEGTWKYYPVVTKNTKPQHFIPQYVEIEELL